MIPVGTPCYIVVCDWTEYIGRVGAVEPAEAGWYVDATGARQYVTPACILRLPDGERIGIAEWSHLKPIVPPNPFLVYVDDVRKVDEPYISLHTSQT